MEPRKLVKVACAKVDGNPDGFYMQYEDEMKSGEVLYGMESPPPPPDLDKMNLEGLKARATELSVVFPSSITKAELRELIASRNAA